MTRWYHGTTTAHGDLTEDWVEPARGQFEPGVVYATSDLKIAQSWANAAAVAHGGEPVIYEIAPTETPIVVETVTGDAHDLGADLIDERVGEGGVPNLHILGRLSARFGQVVR